MVRAACVDDVPRIAAIYGHHVLTGSASFELVAPDAAEMLRRFVEITGQGYPYLAALEAGRLVGYAYASAFRTRPAYRLTVENSVYLDPAEQRRGIGRLLLEALVAECTARGYRQMVAVIGDSANTASIALHTRCGFAHAGLLPATGWKFGRWVDSVLMQRALGAGARTAP